MKTITIYSTPTCHYCHLAKDYFTKHNILFTDVNVSEDKDRLNEMVDMTGQMGVPVITIIEEEKQPIVLVGFNQKLIADTLGIAD
jgi:glutaredoxin